jgi:hypothetical protein
MYIHKCYIPEKAGEMSGKWVEQGASSGFCFADYIIKSSRCNCAHPSNSRRILMGEIVLRLSNIFIELILPCIIFRKRVRT